MRKFLPFFNLLLFIAFISSIFLAKAVFAEEDANPVAFKQICLKDVEYFRDCPGADKNCVDADPPEGYPSENKDHTLRIEGEGFPLNRDIYVVGCVINDDAYKCTTGNSELDKELEENTGFVANTDFPDDFTYVFQTHQNPVQTSTGKLSLIVRSYSSQVASHSFFGVYPFSQTATEGSGSTPQYGSFNFEAAIKNCASIQWDPEGYVFDAQTLVPLERASVTILDEEGNKVPERPGFVNPYTTGTNGSFQFFVEKGKYLLNVQKEGYVFPVSIEEVNSDYNNLDKGHNYRCEIPGFNLYTDQAVIDETEGKLIRCDIPLKREFAGPVSAPDYIIYEQSVYADQGQHLFQAEVWPFFSYVAVTQQTEDGDEKIIYYKKAKDGFWSAIVNSSKLEADKPVFLRVLSKEEVNALSEKGNLDSRYLFRKLNRLFSQIKKLINEKLFQKKDVYAQSKFSKRPLYPVLEYIEGYAYNDQGKVIPNAKVYLVHKTSNKVFLGIRADETGFFKIPSEYLPPFQYYIRVKSPEGENFSYSSADFVRANKGYLKSEQINLLTATKKGRRVKLSQEELATIEASILEFKEKELAQTRVPTIQLEKKGKVTQPQREDSLPEKKEDAKVSLVLVIGLIFALVVIGLFILLYVLKLRKESEF